jgi:hypothetical protein
MNQKENFNQFCTTWAVAFVHGYLAARGFRDDAPHSSEWHAAETEAIEKMKLDPFWGVSNVEAYYRAK